MKKTLTYLFKQLNYVLERYDSVFQIYRRNFLSLKKVETYTKYDKNIAIEEMRSLASEAQEIANEIADRLLDKNFFVEEDKESLNLQIENIYWQYRNVKHSNSVFGNKLPPLLKESFDWLLQMIDEMESNINSYNLKVEELGNINFKIISPEEAKKLVHQESSQYL